MKRLLWLLLILVSPAAFAQSAAFNLSQLAHMLDPGGIVPCAAGGTGITGTPANGQILIGNGVCWTPATITGGSNVTITNGVGTITISSSGGGTPGGNSGQLQANQSGAFAGFDLGGDCTFSYPNITCSTAGGVPIVTTTGTQTLTNKSIAGSEINSGTVGASYLPAALSSSNSINGTAVPATAGTLNANGASWSMAAGFTGSYGSGHLNADQLLGGQIPTLATGCLQYTGSALSWSTCGGAPAFSAVTSATNTTAAMLVGTGSSLGPTGSGTVNANEFNGATAPASQTCLGTNSSSQLVTGSCGGSPAFSAVTAGTNTTAAMVVGSGGSIATSGSGTIAATSLTALSGLPSQAAATVVANVAGSSAAPTATSMSALQSALNSANAVTYSPTLGSGATNDWDPTGGTGIATLGFANTTPNAAGSTVDGVLAGSDKQQFVLCNAAALGTNAEYIILENQSSSDSTAANRLAMAGNIVLGPQMCSLWTYVAGSINRWLVSAVANGGTPPVQPLSSGTSMTPDCSFLYVTETASASGTFTINAPTDCTPQDGQLLRLKITNYSGSASTYSWNSTYHASSTLALPTAGAAASVQDMFAFIYSAGNTRWNFVAANQGF